MSEWAAIVYGRTYHLDFRFITVPHNFEAEDLSWASQHIVATTQQARNLGGSPRWSLFRNNRFCVVGVTATVKDLIGKTVKDNQGRPLYIFVGYVAQISPQQEIKNLPAYSSSLDNFKILYREVESVWLVRNYDPKSRYPAASYYYPISFQNLEIPNYSDLIPFLNQASKHPRKIYLWPNFSHQNKLLWQTAAQHSNTSICLNVKGKALLGSPFLNLSSNQTQQFQMLNRITARHQSQPTHLVDNLSPKPDSSLSQKISNRARDDIDLTLQQATKVAIASQELINNISDWNHTGETKAEELDPDVDRPEFGFKTKKTPPSKQDWF